MKHFLLLVCLFLIVIAHRVWAADVPPNRVWFVTDFGAVGDGETLNTKVLQSVIDTCSNAGGGTVRFTPGTFLSGTLFLKDNVTLNLDAGAVLLGSKNKDDYIPIPRTNIREQPAFHFTDGSFLLYAENVKNVTIEGHGTINGNGNSFWYDEMLTAHVRKPKEWRPRALICFVLSQNIVLQDVTLSDSPTFTFWSIACEDININGIRIINPQKGPNTDGLDLDCCRRVTVSNCIIEGGDDAIAIKSDSGILGAKEYPCEDITITNCVLQSGPACGIRIGYEGDSVIRNCTFSNLTIYDTDIGLDIVSILPNRNDCTILKGTRIKNILFDNITMRNVRQAIYFWMGNELPEQESQLELQDIRVNNVIAECRVGSLIGSFTDQQRIKNIFLSNVTLIPTENQPEGLPLSGSGIWGGNNPYALYIANTENVQIDRFFVDFRAAQGYWSHAVFCENSKDISLDRFSTKNFAVLSSVSQIGLKNSSAFINASHAEPETVFLKAEKSKITLGVNQIEKTPNNITIDADSQVIENR